MDYRREIDGLRALAVVPVILFHAGFQTFSGGFVGVDVFFVISGYLITTIILFELEQGKFSIINFYERRARRILPALFFVMLACLPFAWFWLLPSDMKVFSKSLVAVSLFSSNILFWLESGYFATASELKPLLHTWSLAVEEQYYVFFPLFLMLFWRLGKRWILGLLGLLFLASLGLAQWAAYAKPAAAFFLLPTRGWELLIGAFAAFYFSNRNRKDFSRGLSEVGGWLGVVLIFYAVFTYSKDTPFPGFYALVPTVGTVLIILFATQQTTVGKFVGNKAFVSIGLISYSAYLWHQPLFAFARHIGFGDNKDYIFEFLSMASLLLAVITWRFVESPFRDKRLIVRSVILYCSISLTILFMTIGYIGYKLNGDFGRFSNDERYPLFLERMRGNFGLDKDCEKKVKDADNCRTSSQPEILLWGDSYAMHLAQGFIASNPSIKLIQSTVSQCAPIIGLAPATAIYGAQNCIAGNDFIFELIRRYPSIKYVVLGSPSYQLNGGTREARDGTKFVDDDLAYDYFIKTLDKIRMLGLTPIIFSPPPQSGSDIGLCLLHAEMHNINKSRCDFHLSLTERTQGVVRNALRRIGKDYKVIWLDDGICSNGLCKSSFDNNFLYRDKGHLSYEGSYFLGKKMNFYGLVVGDDSIRK